MKKKYLVLIVGIFLVSLVLAFGHELRGNQGDLNLNKRGIVADQTFMNCLIKEPIKVSYDVIDHDTNLKVFNYSAWIDFGGECVQGLGKSKQINYSGSTARIEFAKELNAKWDIEFNKKTRRLAPKNRTRGGFNG